MNVVIFSGTTEGRALSCQVAALGAAVLGLHALLLVWFGERLRASTAPHPTHSQVADSRSARPPGACSVT